jgi:hypothetical protein
MVGAHAASGVVEAVSLPVSMRDVVGGRHISILKERPSFLRKKRKFL